jgi:alkylated DNA repair dioxygenase AlkB
MELPFRNDHPVHVVTQDGEAIYHGKLLDDVTANIAFTELLSSIAWRNEVVRMFGKELVLSRKVSWYGSQPFTYRYSGITHHALPWTETLIRLKNSIEKTAGAEFNSCLLNLYPTGAEQMGWHSDDEPELEENAAIASLSLGAARKFVFKHKQTKATHQVLLEHGSLLVMRGTIQHHWLHRLPAQKSVTRPRINLTFRRMK